MGYTTDFSGEWEVTPPLTEDQIKYLIAFSETRRMKRDAKIAETLDDPVRIAVGLPIGDEGAYFVGGNGFKGQGDDPSVLDHNEPPGIRRSAKKANEPGWWAEHQALEAVSKLEGAQPGLWCQWVPDESGTTIRWDEGEKFYDYVAWIEYLIKHFLGPWGRKLNGQVYWVGEDSDDRGVIRITDNVIEVGEAQTTYAYRTL